MVFDVKESLHYLGVSQVALFRSGSVPNNLKVKSHFKTEQEKSSRSEALEKSVVQSTQRKKKFKLKKVYILALLLL